MSKIVNSGDTIVYDVKCSKALEDTIIKLGGNPVMWKTGHSLIKNKMIEENAKLGGEMSGHIFFADKYYGFDDAMAESFAAFQEARKNGLIPPTMEFDEYLEIMSMY